MVIALGFEDGSIGTINYFANGSKEYPKEKLEVFSDGRVGRIDNFRATRGFGFKENLRLTTIRQDKGHLDEVRAFVHALEHGGQPLIPLSGSVNVTLATFAAVTSAVENRAIDIRTEFGSFC
jgi:hypothetical protein